MNPHSILKKLEYGAIPRRKIMGSIFFEANVNTDIYSDTIYQFFASLEDDERMCWLQHVGVACHTSRETMGMIR